jgi:hypothetical protein
LQSDIPDDQLKRARARVEQLLEILRRQTALLPREADSALIFDPDPLEPQK